jgi:hypothetical protein
VSAPGDYDNGEIGGMIGRGNRSTRRKPAPVPLCPPQTPHAARTRTRAAAVGNERLTAELRHGLLFRLGDEQFLPSHFQIIIHLSSIQRYVVSLLKVLLIYNLQLSRQRTRFSLMVAFCGVRLPQLL